MTNTPHNHRKYSISLAVEDGRSNIQCDGTGAEMITALMFLINEVALSLEENPTVFAAYLATQVAQASEDGLLRINQEGDTAND